MGKRNWRPVLVVGLIGLMVFGMYMVFRDSYEEIVRLLAGARVEFVLVLVGMGWMYYVMESWILQGIVGEKGKRFSLWEALEYNYLGLFMNVTTFGAGIKPAQAYYLYQKGVDVGEGVGVLILPYVYHKTTIMVYATIVLVVKGDFIRRMYSDSVHYLYAAYFMSAVIIIGLILICTWDRLQRVVFKLAHWGLGKTKFDEQVTKYEMQVKTMQRECLKSLKNPRRWVKYILINLVKVTWWYAIPFVAIRALGLEGGLGSITLLEVIATSAFMQIIVGVIPVTGGMVSTEIVYGLLYSALLGSGAAGATMILYRFATYYLAFLTSIVVVSTLRKKRLRYEEK